MEEQSQLSHKTDGAFSYTLRDFASVVFRHRQLIVLTFLGIFMGATAVALMQPYQYEAGIKVLLTRGRADPMVTTELADLPRSLSTIVTEQDVNSEVELIKSRDLLDKVVVASGLDQLSKNKTWWASIFSSGGKAAGATSDEAQDKKGNGSGGAGALLVKLNVEPVIKSNIITVTYKAPDPQMAARVVNALADLYLDKHLEVHRATGALEFFQQETERYRKGLVNVEAQMSGFGQAQGVASAQLEKEITLRSLSEFEAKFRDSKAAIAETEERIRSLDTELAATPPRLISTVRTSTSREVVQNLKSTLLTLELKRTEMLGKYDPSYRAVQEVEKQIAQTRAALAMEEKPSQQEESTDRNPTYEKLKEQLVGAKSDLPGLKARSAKLAQNVQALQERSRWLYQREIAQNDLFRTQKIAEQNYQLYLHKQEEARISDELDKQRILNVAIVDRATPPLQPSGIPRPLIVLIAGILAGLMSVGLAFGLDLLSPTFRTPDEVRALLNIPVLAAIPKNGE
jgi:uncharacterized protein involved in exopolysaccharide biosynthesis